jgi:microcin C transport system substrate-binding protein
VKDYWAQDLPAQKGLNNFDTIRYDVYRDDTVSLEGIKSHQFDFYEEYIARNWATSYDVPAVKSGALIKTLVPNKIPRGMQGFIFNTRLSKFADPKVRQAIGLTLDFEWMNETLFYGAYERNKSFFGNTEFEAKGLPGADELKLLESYRCTTRGDTEANTVSLSPRERLGEGGIRANVTVPSPSSAQPKPSPSGRGGAPDTSTTAQSTKSCLPASLFTEEYKVPTTDGSGIARNNLIKAQQLLNDAGWVMRNGKRVNAKTGEPLTIEFLMTQRTFERVVGIMRHNLRKLGIESTFRYIDASQYQKRVEKKQFEMVSVWWNLGLFYPSTEQYLYWHSSQADIDGSQNLSGAKNPAIDALTATIQNAQTLEDLRAASRALDRVLTHNHYIIPHWTITAWRIAYWNQFGRPKITPAYNLGIDTWWDKKLDKNAAANLPASSSSGSYRGSIVEPDSRDAHENDHGKGGAK